MEHNQLIEAKCKLQDFFGKEMAIEELFCEQDTANLREVAPELRIARVVLTFYQTVKKEEMNQGDSIVFYAAGESDARKYVHREVTQGGNVALVELYQVAGEPDWDEQEKELLESLSRTLFYAKSRIQMTGLLKRALYYDEDTNLPNFKYGLQMLGRLVGQQQIDNYAAMFVNIKSMFMINELVGFDKGTQVMSLYMHRIQEVIGEQGKVCRIGGDNFLIISPKDKVDAVLEILKGEVVQYSDSIKDRVMISAVSGVYMIPDNRVTVHEVMKSISGTLNIARYVKQVPVLFYDEKLIQMLIQNRRVENEFENAIEQEEFHVFYQPKVSLHNYELKGAEALCRWIREGQIVPPDSFIPILEAGQKICALDFYMLEHVCRDIREWLDDGKAVVKVSVNFSRKHLANMDLVQDIVEVIDQYQIPHELIEVEVTETTTDADFNLLKKLVYDLKQQGISTSVDDFGTGYSSLSLIRDVPFKVLKIDKSFLRQDDLAFQRDNVMMKHVIGMANELDMDCIAEGVETVENIKLLKANKCYLAQGFLFDRPLPKDEFEKRLDGYRYTA